jgi:hypothetical protein
VGPRLRWSILVNGLLSRNKVHYADKQLDACQAAENEHIAITLLGLWCALNLVGSILCMCYYVNAITREQTDTRLSVMILPIVMVNSRLITLELPQRLGLIFVFSLVLIDLAFDIVRTVYSLSAPLANTTNLNAVWTIMVRHRSVHFNKSS